MALNAFGTEKDALTTGEVARVCNVAARTVSKWIDAGRLEGYRIPGSRDRRVHVAALEAFVAANGIPHSSVSAVASKNFRVLFVDADHHALDAVGAVLGGRPGFTVETASNALCAAIVCGAATPDAVIFDCSAGDAVAFITALRSQARFTNTKFVASSSQVAVDERQLLLAGYQFLLRKPYSVRTLVDAIEPLAPRCMGRAG